MIAKNPFKIEAGTTKNLEYSDIRMEPKIKDILNTEIKGDSFPDREGVGVSGILFKKLKKIIGKASINLIDVLTLHVTDPNGETNIESLKDKDTYEEYVIDWANEIKLTKKLRTELVELITDGQYELNAYGIYPGMSGVNLLGVLDDLDLSV